MIFFLVVYHELIKNDIMFIELMRINGLSNNKILKNESIVIFALTIIGVFLSIVVDKFVFKVLYMNSLLKSLTIILILSLVVLLYFRNKIIESLRNMEK